MIKPELEVIFLTTDKKVRRIRKDIDQRIEDEKKLYKLNPDWISIKQIKKTKLNKDKTIEESIKNKNLEVYYFQDCPCPIGSDYKSETFFDELIGENALSQTSFEKKGKFKFNPIILVIIGLILVVGALFYFNPELLKGVFQW